MSAASATDHRSRRDGADRTPARDTDPATAARSRRAGGPPSGTVSRRAGGPGGSADPAAGDGAHRARPVGAGGPAGRTIPGPPPTGPAHQPDDGLSVIRLPEHRNADGNHRVYGYVNRAGLTAPDLHRLVAELQTALSTRYPGLALHIVFAERGEPYRDAFHDLINHLLAARIRGTRIYYVVIPTLAHLSERPSVRAAMRAQLETDTGVLVREVGTADPASDRASDRGASRIVLPGQGQQNRRGDP